MKLDQDEGSRLCFLEFFFPTGAYPPARVLQGWPSETNKPSPSYGHESSRLLLGLATPFFAIWPNAAHAENQTHHFIGFGANAEP